jgi:hypothetical protein
MLLLLLLLLLLWLRLRLRLRLLLLLGLLLVLLALLRLRLLLLLLRLPLLLLLLLLLLLHPPIPTGGGEPPCHVAKLQHAVIATAPPHRASSSSPQRLKAVDQYAMAAGAGPDASNDKNSSAARKQNVSIVNGHGGKDHALGEQRPRPEFRRINVRSAQSAIQRQGLHHFSLVFDQKS